MTERTPPESTAGDKIHALVKGGIGSVPVVGNVAAEIFGLLISPPLEARRQEWMESIVEGLSKLEENDAGLVDRLSKDGPFIDTLVQASLAQLRTSDQEKREAFRNAVLNSALPHPPEMSKRQLYIQWVDALTVWHLRILKLLADPADWYQVNNRKPPQFVMTSSLSQLIGDAFPAMTSEDALMRKIGKDLYAAGLTGTESLNSSMSASGAFDQRATELGRGLLQFISAPPGVDA